MSKSLFKVGIIGGSGYVGRELIEILLTHPQVSIEYISARELAGKNISSAHRSLSGVSDLSFCAFDPAKFSLCDVVFSCVSHGASMELVSLLAEQPRFNTGELRIVDLSGDFRLTAQDYERTYKVKHVDPALCLKAVYGAPEIWPELVQKAQVVANPGCFANCITLALAPLAKKRLLQNPVHVSAITGSSGSGNDATLKTHHPERNESFAAYNVLSHRHAPEIARALGLASLNEQIPSIELVPVSGPITRGIFATCFVSLSEPIDVARLYEQFAAENIFIRLRTDTPRLIDVVGTNFCDISVHQHGNQVVIISALDNLSKGAAGNAVQCMNLMLGFDQALGLI